jgi:hypothetical protein
VVLQERWPAALGIPERTPDEGNGQRHGPDACENATSIREDLLLQEVARTFKDLFEDADSIIEEATAEAQRLMRKNRGEVRRLGGQLAEIERKVGSLTRLLCDPDIGPLIFHSSRCKGRSKTAAGGGAADSRFHQPPRNPPG